MKNKSIVFFLTAALSFNSVVYAADFSAPAAAHEESATVVEALEPENPDGLMEEDPEVISDTQEPTEVGVESDNIQIETENSQSASADFAETDEEEAIFFEDGASVTSSAYENSAASADDNIYSAEGQNVYQGFVYEENEDGTLSITGYCGEEKEHLVVPETINEKEVTRVKDGFADSIKDSLISIKMPSIVDIDAYTFSYCEKLKIVEAPQLISLSGSVFYHCYSLSKINLEQCRSIHQSAFLHCQALTEINLPNVIRIYRSVFYGCSSLKNVYLPKLESIGDSAFQNCSSLETIDLSSVIQIGKMAFVNCPNLKSVIFSNATESMGTVSFGYSIKDGYRPENYLHGLTFYCPSGSMASIYGHAVGIPVVWTDVTPTPVPTTPTVTPAPTVTPIPTATPVLTLNIPRLSEAVPSGTKKMTVNWAKVPGADGYRVFVRSNGKWQALGNTASTFYIYTKAKSGQTYTFTVRAYKKTNSGYIWSAYNKNGIRGIALDMPKLSKAAIAGTGKINLSWTKTAAADGYRVFVKYNGKWQALGNTASASYTYPKAKSGRTYTFTVRAYKKNGSGYIWSSYDKTGITATALDTPKLNKIRRSGTRAAINWKKVSGSTGYVIYRKAGTGQWKRVGIVTNGTSFTDRNLKKGTKYTYTVRAYVRVNGKSTYSSYDKKGLSVTVR